jgi:AcrR family transcriptional regulator
MRKSDFVKETIMIETMDLIKKSSGNINEITTRQIAERAGVGVGLINYHFTSKDLLIEQCVQKIIKGVIEAFQPEISKDLSPVDRLKTIAKMVTDFLVENPSVSRISILGDYQNPKSLDNTMKTVNGFLGSFTDSDITNNEKRLLLFNLTCMIQAAFLRKDISKECLGFNFNNKKERDKYIDFLVDRLFS